MPFPLREYLSFRTIYSPVNLYLKLIFAFIFFTSLNIHYKKKGIAIVKCDDVERLESNLGQINVPRWNLGQLKYFVSDSSCLVQDLGVNLDTNDIKQHTNAFDKGNTIEISLSKGLEVSVQGKLSNNSLIKADLQSKLKSKASFVAYNYSQNKLNDIIELLNKDQKIKDAFKTLSAGLFPAKFFIINTVLIGDSLTFNLDKNKSGSAQVSVASFGIDFKISFDCASSYKKKGGSGTLLMFQYLCLDWDSSSNSIVPSKNPFKINNCTFISYIPDNKIRV